MQDNPITLTPSDFIGAVQRGLSELNNHLVSTPALAVNVPAVKDHLAHLVTMLDALEKMQAAIAAQQAASGNRQETRAN